MYTRQIDHIFIYTYVEIYYIRSVMLHLRNKTI